MDNTTIDKTVDDIATLISEGNTENAQIAIDAAISSGIDAKVIVKAVADSSIEKIEDAFCSDKIFLPVLVKSSEFIADVIDKEYGNSEMDFRKTVVIGTVLGDIHEIGKNLCAAALKCRGYKVIDIGCDAHPDKFITLAKNNKAQLIAVSAPMSTTRPVQKVIVNNAKSEIGDIYVLVGGAACSQKWCDEIKASGYSKDWKEFIHLVDSKIGD